MALALALPWAGCGDTQGTPSEAGSPDARIDAPADARPDAPPPDAPPDRMPADGLPLGTGCGTYSADGGVTDGGVCNQGLLCCPTCCQSPAASCAAPAQNDAGIGIGQCALPDLHIDEPTLRNEITVGPQDFPPDSCEIMEGCITTPGTRTLLGFSVKTPNFGTADLNLGDPANNPLFEYSQCHGHYHFRGYAQYRLLDATGTTVVTGRKQAFCLLDLERQPFPLGSDQYQYDCGNQGISVGWADIYSNGLPCQYLDVTDVPDGTYTLEITINPEHIIPELDYSNNTATATVRLGSMSSDPLLPCGLPTQGGDRDCGWTDGPTLTCTAGSQLAVGCGAACGLGTCTGDTVLRVCAGGQACRHAAALAENDDCSGTTFCSATSVLCPSTGQVHVMTGAWDSTQAATCNLAHNP